MLSNTLTRIAGRTMLGMAIFSAGAALVGFRSDRLLEASLGRAIGDRTAHAAVEKQPATKLAGTRQLVGDEHFWLASGEHAPRLTPAIARDYGVAIGNHIQLGRPGRPPIVLEIVGLADAGAADRHNDKEGLRAAAAPGAPVVVIGRIAQDGEFAGGRHGTVRLVLDPVLLRTMVVEGAPAGRSL